MVKLPDQPMRGIFGSHTFTCALLTRGGVCDCQRQTSNGRVRPARQRPPAAV
jgi:hypothetical protein